MQHSSQNLFALIGSRICHDLISPIGAITNGLELMQMTGSALTPEVALISESVGDATARICFFRVAYGLAAPNQVMTRPEIIRILNSGALATRVKVLWHPVEDISRAEIRLAFLALQCFETLMPYGGQVAVTQDTGCWTLTGNADKWRARPDLLDHLTDPTPDRDIAPADVQFLVLPLLLGDDGRRISLTQTDGQITLQF